MKKTLIILAAMMILCLCGCTESAEPTKTSNKPDAGEMQPLDESIDTFGEQDAQKSSDSTGIPEKSGNVSKPLKEETTETKPGKESQSANENKPDCSFEQVKPSSEESKAETPSKPPETEKPKEPEPPKETAPPAESKPEPKPEPEPSFDIDYWISYAQEVARSKGLILESDATESWDNPLTANPDCIYLERDINSRLNRYAKDEDITEVWIWYESVGTNSYLIYVGYA